jgi:hypothetical protein
MPECHFLKRQSDLDAALFEEMQNEEQEKTGEERFLCRQCLHPITKSSSRLQKNGQHVHSFSNPAGITFRIGCFSAASGCRLSGPKVAAYSWFAGFTWQLALCGNCHSHLGWHFDSADADQFFALILAYLVPSPS